MQSPLDVSSYMVWVTITSHVSQSINLISLAGFKRDSNLGLYRSWCPRKATQKSKIPHCLLWIFFTPLDCFVSHSRPLLRPRVRPIPNFGKPRFNPSSKTQALHHFCRYKPSIILRCINMCLIQLKCTNHPYPNYSEG